ncbi:hypothetical protein KDL01_10830 [Actinospica durhamensis]|uniref:Uncharacterized protein n=1 Tax=Actinospica durhamensis TaxID=1508375 RepID=A0A941ELC7_9ACTN|nr:hypothetical protein [Actinospica durhamensis]MBR7833762.1 hypothetical protein [Actinospica durhamensis]
MSGHLIHRHRHRAVAAGIAVLASATAGGCAAGASGGAGPTGYAAPTSTARAGAVTEPTPNLDLKTLLQQPATAGSAEVGSFVAASGQVWIDFSCVGNGTAKLSYQPVGSLDIPCADGAVNATRNQVAFPAGQVTLKVQTSDTVQWSILIQQ